MPMPIVMPNVCILKTPFLFSIHRGQQASQRVWYIPVQAIWYIQPIPLKIYFNTGMVMCIGVPLILGGLQVIPILFMAPWQTVQLRLCLKGCPHIRIMDDFGRLLKSIK